MNRFAQLWRTTTVRLTAVFIALFVLFSILLLAFIAYQSSIQIQQQQTAQIDREVDLLKRIDQREGVRGIVFAVARLSSQPGPGIYYLGDNSGLQIAGKRFDDLGVLQVARAFEIIRGEQRPWPQPPSQAADHVD